MNIKEWKAVAAGLLTAVVVLSTGGCSSDSSDEGGQDKAVEASGAVHGPEADGEEPEPALTDRTLPRRPFCAKVDDSWPENVVQLPVERVERRPGDSYTVGIDGEITIEVDDFTCEYFAEQYSGGSAQRAVVLSRGVRLVVTGQPVKPSWLEPADTSDRCEATELDASALGPSAIGYECVDKGKGPAELKSQSVVFKAIVGSETGYTCDGTLPLVEADGFGDRVLALCVETLKRIAR